MNLGVGLGGIVGGLIAHVANPGTLHDPLPPRRADVPRLRRRARASSTTPACRRARRPAPASYRAVLRHKTFLGLWALNFLFVAAGYSLLSLFPQFARDQSGITERQIGLVFAVNTAAIVLAQLPISHWIEGRRRMRALALMPLLWAVCLADRRRRPAHWLEATAAFVGLRLRAGASSGSANASTARLTRRSSRTSGPSTCAGATSPCTRCRGGSPGAVGPAVGGFILAARAVRCSGRSPRSCAWSRRAERSRSSATSRSGLRRIPHDEAAIPGARRARARLTGTIAIMPPIVEDPLSTGAEASANAQPAPHPPHAQPRPRGRRRAPARPR